MRKAEDGFGLEGCVVMLNEDSAMDGPVPPWATSSR